MLARLVALAVTFAASLVLAGCEAEIRAQLVVIVHSDLIVPTELDEVRLNVRAPGDPPDRSRLDRFVALGPAAESLPFSFGVAPLEEDFDRSVRVEAIGRVGEDDTVSTFAISSFVEGERLRLDLFLVRRCIDVVCEPMQTCGRNGCMTGEVDPATLPPFTGDLTPTDGGTPPPPPPDAGDSGSPTLSTRGDTGIANSHICAIHTDASLWCWGGNDFGQIGNGGMAYSEPPQQIHPGPWASVDANIDSTCAIDAGGLLHCWGLNATGQLGLGDTTARNRPTQVGTARWSQISVGVGFTCGIRMDASIWCWGDNATGQLGIGMVTAPMTTPQPVMAGTRFTQLNAADSFAIALTEDGVVWAWGSDGDNHLGAGDGSYHPTPFATPLPAPATLLHGGSHHTLLTLDDGRIYAFGLNAEAQLGVGDATPRASLVPVTVELGGPVFAGGHHSCVIRPGNDVYCWGYNVLGQLGVKPGADFIPTPQLVGLPDQPWASLTLGEVITCARGTDSSLWCWGANARSALAQSETGYRIIPFRILPP